MSADASAADRRDRLRLIRSERVGPRTFRGLVAQHGSAAAALAALPALARRAGRGSPKIMSEAAAEREIAAVRGLGGRFVFEGESAYPKALRAIDTAPPVLAVLGEVDVLAQPCIAIVGSRNASAAGGIFTERLSSELGRAGFVVVSGLARGIDTRAHRAAIESGTVAVLAGGLDRVYPPDNKPLLAQILAAGGAVVSEMPLGWEPRGQDFPRRNRIVSGLSYGVVVVEAARRSGSLITARFALEQGREVFAVPGSPLDLRAEGTNDLIRGGATLCASADHVIAALAPLVDRHGGATEWPVSRPDGCRAPVVPFDDDGSEDASPDDEGMADARPSDAPAPDHERLLALLGPVPVGLDDLCRQAGLTVATLQRLLVELELEGRVRRHAGPSVSRA